MTDCRCLDCKCSVYEMPLDCVLTGEQWNLICPEGFGVLCANCIIKRASKLPHVIDLTARITFDTDYDSDEPGSDFFQELKAAEELEFAISGGHEKVMLSLDCARRILRSLRNSKKDDVLNDVIQAACDMDRIVQQMLYAESYWDYSVRLRETREKFREELVRWDEMRWDVSKAAREKGTDNG